MIRRLHSLPPILAVALCFGLFVIRGASADGKLDQQVKGHIAKLFTGADNALVLTSAKGITLEVMKIGNGCLIFLNGQRASAEDLRVGLQAAIHFNEYTRVAYHIEAVTPPYLLDGPIESIELANHRLKLVGLNSWINFDEKTLISLNGKMVFAQELHKGQKADIECAALERNGDIEKIDKQDRKIYLKDQRESLFYQDGWNFYRGQKPVFISDLAKGERISFRKNTYQALRIDAKAGPKKKMDKDGK